MPLVINPAHAYAFLGGLFIGKFTNIFGDVVIAGLMVYIVSPDIYTEERLTRAKNYFWSWVRPNQVQQFIRVEADPSNMIENKPVGLFSMASLPKIELMSPNPIVHK